MSSAYYSRNCSYSRSYNAEAAESQNCYPLSRAKKFVADDLGCSQAVAAAALGLLHDGEWHHVGKFASRVNYYNAIDPRLPGVVAHIQACGGVRKFNERRKTLREARRDTTWCDIRNPGRFTSLSAYVRRSRQVVVEVLGRDCFTLAVAQGDKPAGGDALVVWLAWRNYEAETIRRVVQAELACY